MAGPIIKGNLSPYGLGLQYRARTEIIPKSANQVVQQFLFHTDWDRPNPRTKEYNFPNSIPIGIAELWDSINKRDRGLIPLIGIAEQRKIYFKRLISGRPLFKMESGGLASEAMNSSSCIFPDDVMLEILSRLPARSLVRFRCVCKPWNSLFHNPHFVRQQLNHASKSPSTFFSYSDMDTCEVAIYSFMVKANVVVPRNEFVIPMMETFLFNNCFMSNPCNGLIAISKWGYAYMANPCTREWMALPEVSSNITPSCVEESTYLGLGFCLETGKYKVVRCFNRAPCWDCEVLTVGTDRCWRPLEKMPYPVTEFEPAYANGYLYWSIDADYDDEYQTCPEFILSFDVCREKFVTVKLPRCDPKPYGAYRHLCVSVLEGGSVCLIDWRVHIDNERFRYLPVMNIYVLRNHEDSIWTKSHSLRLRSVKFHPKGGWIRGPAGNNMFPVEIKDGKVLLNRPCKSWRIHDMHTGASPTIRLPPRMDRNRIHPFVCAESIVPLDRLPEDRTA